MSGLTRREVIQGGGMVLAIGAIGAACANNDAGGTPGRIGFAPPPPTLPEVEDPPSDATLLRTAQSMEYAALELYEQLMAMDVLTDDEQPVFTVRLGPFRPNLKDSRAAMMLVSRPAAVCIAIASGTPARWA